MCVIHIPADLDLRLTFKLKHGSIIKQMKSLFSELEGRFMTSLHVDKQYFVFFGFQSISFDLELNKCTSLPKWVMIVKFQHAPH